MADERANASLLQLVDEHHAAVYRYAYRLTGSVQDAEDLTQQVFLLAQQRLEQLREIDRARGWLFAILRTSFLKSVQKAQPAAATDKGMNLESIPAEEEPSPVVDPIRLQAAMDELPAEFRVVLALYYFEDCSYKEIAAKLKLPIGTVMSRLARAKGHLKTKLIETEPASK